MLGAQVGQPVQVEVTAAVTAPEVAGAHLQDQLAPQQVVGRHASLPGVVEAAGQRAATIDRFDGHRAQGPEAHRGHVDDRGGSEHRPPTPCLAQHLRARHPIVVAVRARQREHALVDDDVIGRRLEIGVGAEREVVVDPLGRGVDPAPLVAVERTFLAVVGDDVLAQLRPHRFEQIAKMADEREISQDGVLALGEVVAGDDRENHDYGDTHPQPPGHELNNLAAVRDSPEAYGSNMS